MLYTCTLNDTVYQLYLNKKKKKKIHVLMCKSLEHCLTYSTCFVKLAMVI